MIDGHRKTNFSGTYYFADTIANVLLDPLEYMANDLEAFCDGEAAHSFLRPFPRWSALHRFASFMIDSLFYEIDVRKYEPPDEVTIRHQRFLIEVGADTVRELWVERSLREHGLSFEPFSDWNRSLEELGQDDAYYWFQELRQSEEYDKLIEHLARDVFAILFANRAVLRDLNRMIAHDLCDAGPPDPNDDEGYARFATKKGLAKRTDIPAWAKRAVFFRDRGRCGFCQRDLSGILSPLADLAYDHIVPLAEGGINDVTNLQLLCGPCNRDKSSRHDQASNFYGVWYDDTRSDERSST